MLEQDARAGSRFEEKVILLWALLRPPPRGCRSSEGAIGKLPMAPLILVLSRRGTRAGQCCSGGERHFDFRKRDQRLELVAARLAFPKMAHASMAQIF
jgi:hypothetical protein